MTDPTARSPDQDDDDDIDSAVRAATRALERIARSSAEEVRARVAVPTFSPPHSSSSQTQRALNDASRATSTAVVNASEPSWEEEQRAFKRAKNSLDLAAQVSERARADEGSGFDQARMNVVRDKMNTIVTDVRERVNASVRAVEIRAREAMDDDS